MELHQLTIFHHDRTFSWSLEPIREQHSFLKIILCYRFNLNYDPKKA